MCVRSIGDACPVRGPGEVRDDARISRFFVCRPAESPGMIMVRNGDWRDCAVLAVDSVERHERQTIDFSTIPRSCGTPRGNRPNPRAVPQA